MATIRIKSKIGKNILKNAKNIFKESLELTEFKTRESSLSELLRYSEYKQSYLWFNEHTNKYELRFFDNTFTFEN